MRVMRNLIVVLVTLLIAALAGCATSDRGQNPGAASVPAGPGEPPTAEQVRAIAKEAYVYGFPMVDSYRIQPS